MGLNQAARKRHYGVLIAIMVTAVLFGCMTNSASSAERGAERVTTLKWSSYTNLEITVSKEETILWGHRVTISGVDVHPFCSDDRTIALVESEYSLSASGVKEQVRPVSEISKSEEFKAGGLNLKEDSCLTPQVKRLLERAKLYAHWALYDITHKELIILGEISDDGFEKLYSEMTKIIAESTGI